MASIVKRKKKYSVVYTYTDENGNKRQKWETFETNVGRAEEYKAAKSALVEGLGLEHLFDHSHELTPKEKEIWMLFDRVDVAELLARDAFAKGAYMLGAEDREIMLK